MSAEDLQRPIVTDEMMEFIDVVEPLSPYMKSWPPGFEEAMRQLHGEEDTWSPDLKLEFQESEDEIGYSKSASLVVDGKLVFVNKEKIGTIDGLHASVLRRGVVRWMASTFQYEETETMSGLTICEYSVGKTSNLPPVAFFRQRDMLKNEKGEYEGFVSEEMREVLDDMLGDDRPDFWSYETAHAIEELTRISEEERRQAAELEELTGILPNLFTLERFNQIMGVLTKANPDNLVPEL